MYLQSIKGATERTLERLSGRLQATPADTQLSKGLIGNRCPSLPVLSRGRYGQVPTDLSSAPIRQATRLPINSSTGNRMGHIFNFKKTIIFHREVNFLFMLPREKA
jgi:hypothetical protein